MKRLFIVFVLSLIVIPWTATAKLSREQVLKLHKPHAYKGLNYRIMEPINFDKSKKYPLILSLHGAGGKGGTSEKALRDWNTVLAEEKMRKDYPCYVLVPHSGEGGWKPDHLKKIQEVIKEMKSVDMSRIYILGHSMGGMGTYTFIRTDPKYFAAAAPSAGIGKPADVKKIKDVNLWVFHGDKDGVVGIKGDQALFDVMKKSNGNMKFTTFKGAGHGIAPSMVNFNGDDKKSVTEISDPDRCDPEPNFMKWIFSKKLK